MEGENKTLKIIHFNDVYNITENEKSEVCGGVARFAAKMDQIKKEHPETVILFSGDLWSPSKETTLFNGIQLIKPINKCHIDVACLGNHDLTLCKCDTELDCFFSTIRTRESAVGNLFADIMRKTVSADCSLLNSGTLRADRLYEPGFLSVGDLNDINPYHKAVDLVEVTGEDLISLLEEGVSAAPALEGRFPMVSNIEFEYDPTKPPFHRVDAKTIKVAGLPLIKSMKYRIASSFYLTSGKDGYETFKKSKPLLDIANATALGDMVMAFFDLADSRKFREEYKVYQQNQEIVSKNFIRERVKMKVEQDAYVKECIARWKEQDAEMPDPSELHLRRKSSLAFERKGTYSPDSKSLINILSRHNIDLLLQNKAKLSIGCLVRLRLYQLIKGTALGPDGHLVFVVGPEVEQRVRPVVKGNNPATEIQEGTETTEAVV